VPAFLDSLGSELPPLQLTRLRVYAERGHTLAHMRALAAGIAFPHDCTVGTCGSCRSRLVSGKVDAITPFGYTLSREELAGGYILACQAVPESDLVVEIDIADGAAAPVRTAARLVGMRERIVKCQSVASAVGHDGQIAAVPDDRCGNPRPAKVGKKIPLTVDCAAHRKLPTRKIKQETCSTVVRRYAHCRFTITEGHDMMVVNIHLPAGGQMPGGPPVMGTGSCGCRFIPPLQQNIQGGKGQNLI
jgi:ferredoxin